MDYTMNEVLQFVAENDVKFIRLTFCDIFGTVKNVSILAEELPRAFENGVSFDASAIRGFLNVEESDLLLFPDPTTIMVLPWRPQQGRVARFYCDIRRPDGTPFEGDVRHILKDAVSSAQKQGYSCQIGSECEFYLFEVNENGNPVQTPQDRAGYLDIAPLDKGENIRREICLTLEEMGLSPESSHHEQGPGQNEIDFRHADALTAADHLVTFKTAVKTIAAKYGLFASFMPKPLLHQAGSGLHINMSLSKNGMNLFKSGTDEHSAESESFIAGVLDKAREMTAFLNPLTNSYERFGSFEAPQYVTWSHQNRSQLVRIPAARGEYARMELRSPDPSCNPYLAFALLIDAGMEGVSRKLSLCPPADINLFEADAQTTAQYEQLPQTLGEAVQLARNSNFIKSVIPQATLEKILHEKEREWKDYLVSEDTETFELERYFTSI